MKAIETKLKGCYILEPTVYNDERGYFYEAYNKESFNKLVNDKVDFVQDNISFSVKGTLRGLHYQKGEFTQAKLVRVTKGEVLDVAVDIREDSPTYMQYESIILSEENKKQFFVPKGFAHGFIVLSKEAIFTYKCDNYYNKESEGGIRYNDSRLNIDWMLDESEFVISEKDLKLY